MRDKTNPPNGESPIPQKRRYTFLPEPDVEAALVRAKRAGFVITGIINKALRAELEERGLCRKSDPEPKKW